MKTTILVLLLSISLCSCTTPHALSEAKPGETKSKTEETVPSASAQASAQPPRPNAQEPLEDKVKKL